MNFSPDTLVLNPELAKQLKKSRAKTPGGKGHHGHVPDAQDYIKAGSWYPPANELLTTLTQQYIWLYRRYAPQCDEATKERVRALLEEVRG